MQITVSTAQPGAHGAVFTAEVPVVVHADEGLITVLTGEGPVVVLPEEVIVGLPSRTYKSVAAAPHSRDRQEDPY